MIAQDLSPVGPERSRSIDFGLDQTLRGSALAPVINPLFPNIPIGVFAPLVGARPFDRAPHTGNVRLDYERGKFGITGMVCLVGRRDASTVLSDGFSGTSMLLLDRNLLEGYQLLELSGRYSLTRRLPACLGAANMLRPHDQEKMGYPALPLSFRAGLKSTIGGQGGWWK